MNICLIRIVCDGKVVTFLIVPYRNCRLKIFFRGGNSKPRNSHMQTMLRMPNLNYNVPQYVPQDVPQYVPQDKLDVQIVDLIRKDRKISTEKMAIVIGVSSKTIKRHIKEMDNVCYVGRGFSGHWEIMDDE